MEREAKPKGDDEEIPEYEFPFQIGRYTILKMIGRGGMGEVFLADDPVCGRQVALKRIVGHRKDKQSARDRFKKEVRIAAQLAHPTIVPIYDLHEDEENLYYTMPYLQGETLRIILVKTRIANDNGLPPHIMGGSIPSLMLAFLNICQAVEHTHSKGFLHRDLKPENIIVGKYNEVTILDWGVATEIVDVEEEPLNEEEEEAKNQTNIRAAAGTIDYMSPERAFRQPATIKSDIYSLGIILHFMLTLQLPYDRPREIKEWRQQLREKGFEPPVDPQEVAPYREITQQLTRITLKCLHPDPNQRYDSVKNIITDLQRYIQGRPDWIPMQQLNINNTEDWEFQESVMLTKQMAISRYAGLMEWLLVILSKESYSGNIQVQTMIRPFENSGGIGFMLCVPGDSRRESLEKGFLVWIGSKETPGCKLFRDNVEVTRVDDVYLEPGEVYSIAVERQDNFIRLLINDQQKLVYMSHVPLVGGHFGIVSRDVEFEISPIQLSSGSQNVLVNCLAVPDAFLLNKDYTRAITEYRRIANSFKGRPEGREAVFRAGYALIKQAQDQKGKAKEYFQKALDEFETLHQTPGAPIEYLGKALVYQAENNLEEELKCLELGVRKFPKHPLRYVLDEHILFRLHETAQKDRIGAYAYTLLTLRHVPKIYKLSETSRLTKNLSISWEDLPFIQTPANFSEESEETLQLSIQLAFWLARPNTIYELIQAIPNEYKHREVLLQNGLFSLLELRYPKLIDFILSVKYRNEPLVPLKEQFEIAIDEELSLSQKLDRLLTQKNPILLSALFRQGLTLQEAPKLLPYFEKAPQFETEHLWALLLSRKKRDSEKLLEGKDTSDPSSLFFMFQGCFLALTQGEDNALNHFDSLIETSFPATPSLLGHFLKGHIDTEGPWFKQAFLWEKVQLYRQLSLYYTCLDKPRKAAHYETLIDQTFSESAIPLNFI
ncbi:MAG: protein kinase [Chlamydiia bacterium]|nr:protein kinase [Chlamydiia bacterium]